MFNVKRFCSAAWDTAERVTVLVENGIFKLCICKAFIKMHKVSSSLGTKTLKLCQCDSSFDSDLCFDSEIRLAFENRFYSERVVVQSCPDLNDDAYIFRLRLRFQNRQGSTRGRIIKSCFFSEYERYNECSYNKDEDGRTRTR